MASKILKKNTNNRPVSDGTVKRYAKAMKDGKWHFNGEPIIIASDDSLLDGQHRLQAIIASGLPQPMIMVKGVNKNAYKTIDVGKKRSAADALATYDKDYTKHRAIIAAAITTISHFKNWSYDEHARSNVMYHEDVIDFLEKNKKLLKSVGFIAPMSGAKKLAPYSCLVALHFLFSQKDNALSQDFFNKLNSGEGLSKNHPVLLLRNRLVEIRHAGGVFRSREVIPYLVKAWELLRRNEAVERLRVNPDWIPVIV